VKSGAHQLAIPSVVGQGVFDFLNLLPVYRHRKFPPLIRSRVTLHACRGRRLVAGVWSGFLIYGSLVLVEPAHAGTQARAGGVATAAGPPKDSCGSTYASHTLGWKRARPLRLESVVVCDGQHHLVEITADRIGPGMRRSTRGTILAVKISAVLLAFRAPCSLSFRNWTVRVAAMI
jgi:hypothetical protein